VETTAADCENRTYGTLAREKSGTAFGGIKMLSLFSATPSLFHSAEVPEKFSHLHGRIQAIQSLHPRADP
jgi:hypothetical protein